VEYDKVFLCSYKTEKEKKRMKELYKDNQETSVNKENGGWFVTMLLPSMNSFSTPRATLSIYTSSSFPFKYPPLAILRSFLIV
jgi:hypothetical protein